MTPNKEEIGKLIEKSSLSLTELEFKFLTTFISELYAEPGFSDVDVKDISKICNMDVKVARGVASSLCKKNIIIIDEDWDNIIYLQNEYWDLHPIWRQEK